MANQNYKSEWERSYQNGDNFVFYPHEEVIRFSAKYIRKRTGFQSFTDVFQSDRKPRWLDLGCGIGRHVIFGHHMGFDSYGIDLSETAVQVAIEWARKEGMEHPEEKIVQGYSQSLPWEDEFFDFVVSHGVLDSMHFEVAKDTVKEVHRVMKPGGLFYCDLISGDDFNHSREYAGEEIVQTLHEQGTVQSYFNFGKIERLFDRGFGLVECNLVRKENVLSGGYHSRYHVVVRRD